MVVNINHSLIKGICESRISFRRREFVRHEIESSSNLSRVLTGDYTGSKTDTCQNR